MRAVRVAVDVALACVFVALLATPVTYAAFHEWAGVAAFALVVAHLVLSWRRLCALARRRSPAALAGVALDVLLVLCMAGQMASAVVLSEHVLAWAPAVPGASWARVAHLVCSYWGFALAFVHAGVHLRVLAGRAGKGGAAWLGRVLFVVCAVVGVRAFLELNMAAYLTLQSLFVFVDPAKPLYVGLLEYACIGVAIAGAAHYVAQIARAAARRRRGKQVKLPRGGTRRA